MARIAGVNIPSNKRVVIALQYIHGIGPKSAKDIVTKVGIEDARRVNALSDAEVHKQAAIDRSDDLAAHLDARVRDSLHDRLHARTPSSRESLEMSAKYSVRP